MSRADNKKKKVGNKKCDCWYGVAGLHHSRSLKRLGGYGMKNLEERIRKIISEFHCYGKEDCKNSDCAMRDNCLEVIKQIIQEVRKHDLAELIERFRTAKYDSFDALFFKQMELDKIEQIICAYMKGYK